MNPRFKKIALAASVALVLAPTLFLLKPQTSEAFINCLAGQIFGTAKNKVLGAVDKALSVPTHDASNYRVNSTTSTATKNLEGKDCYMDFLVRVLANTVIRTMTKSIVNWINSGFEGSPSFVTDFEGFVTDVGDQVIGQSIYELGALGEVLCSPFDLKLRLALGLAYSSTYRDKVVCRLSDIQENVYNAFVGGQFGGDAGWQRWFDMQMSPQNTPDGAFLAMSDNIDFGIVSATGRETQQLNWGRGFLSFQDCEHYEERPNGTGGWVKGKCDQKGTIRTPGAVIEEQVNEMLPSNLRSLELADEINEIFGALVNVAMQQVFSSSGLFGASQPSHGGGRSWTDNLASGNTSYDFEKEITLGTAQIPAGITTTCAEFNKNVYQILSTSKPEYKAPPYSERAVVVQTPIPGTSPVRYSNPKVTQKTVDGQILLWSPRDLENMQAFCNRSPLESASAVVRGEAADDVDYGDDGTISTPGRNLSFRRPARQSSNWSDYFSADRAVDGVTATNSFIEASVTCCKNYPNRDAWWEVELEKLSGVEKVTIYKRTGYSYLDSLGTFTIFLYDESRKEVAKVHKVARDGDPIPYEVSVKGNAKFVRIQRTGEALLQLGEVEVYGTTGSDQAAGVGGVTQSFSVSPEIAPSITLRPAEQATSTFVLYTTEKRDVTIHLRMERRPLGSTADFVERSFSSTPFSKFEVATSTTNVPPVFKPIITYTGTTKNVTPFSYTIGTVPMQAEGSLAVDYKFETAQSGVEEGEYRVVAEMRKGDQILGSHVLIVQVKITP